MQLDRDVTQNQYGCPFTFQSGHVAIQEFEHMLEHLSPEWRAAFERERAERERELNSILATSAHHS